MYDTYDTYDTHDTYDIHDAHKTHDTCNTQHTYDMYVKKHSENSSVQCRKKVEEWKELRRSLP